MAVPPGLKPPKAGLQAHPFLRECAALSAFGRRSRTPATPPLGRKHLEKKVQKSPQLGRPAAALWIDIEFQSFFILHHYNCYFFPFPVFSTIAEGVAGGGERLPSGKHRLPLPLEGVSRRRGFARLRPGGTAVGGSPSRG